MLTVPPNAANLYTTSPERGLFVSLVFAVAGITTRTGNLGANMTSASLVVALLEYIKSTIDVSGGGTRFLYRLPIASLGHNQAAAVQKHVQFFPLSF